MKRTKQISISLENEPGRLAHVCACLAKRQIDILAISVVEGTEQATVRLVVDRPAVAMKMLKDCPMTVTTRDVLVLELPNKVGMLAKVAGKLAARKVNIQYVYGSACKGTGKSRVIIAAPNLSAAQRAVARLG